MEASEAHAWRPLGALLVAQGVLSEAELEGALAEQERTGERLGETLVRLNLASPPVVVDALAEQAGLLFEPERGFGTGLRAEIVRRHRVRHESPADEEAEAGADAEADEPVVEVTAPPPAPRPQTVAAGELAAELSAAIGRASEHLAARRAALPPLV